MELSDFLPWKFFGHRARYGVLLEKGPFKQRTADFLWMMIFGAWSLLVIGLIPHLYFPFMGPSLVFMMLYVWSREVPNAQISIAGLVTIQGVHLPWAMLALDLIFSNPLLPDILGILAGHLYYFLAVLYPLSGQRNILKTPLWVYPSYLTSFFAEFRRIVILSTSHDSGPLTRLVVYWGVGAQMNSPVQADQHAGVAFRGRSYRLNG